MNEPKRSAALEKHLAEEHNQSAIAEYLKEIIYGGNDGIVTTFAVVAGFSGASLSGNQIVDLSFLTVLLFGLANLFADGLSMGLGNFLSVRAEQDVFDAAEAKERREIRNNTHSEYEETIDILIHKGFSPKDATDLTNILQKNEDYWVDWMMHHELEMEDPSSINPFYTGLATFLSFLFFGAIPLLPYIFLTELSVRNAFIASCIATAIALILLGIVKWRVISHKFWSSIAEMLVIGGTSAIAAFLVGILFKGG